MFPNLKRRAVVAELRANVAAGPYAMDQRVLSCVRRSAPRDVGARTARGLLSLAAVAGICGFAATARAIECDDATLALPNPLYGAGGSAITAELGKVATALRNLSTPVTVIWSDPSACTGFGYFTSGVYGDITSTRTLKYWDPAGVQQTCTLAPGKAIAPAFAHMGNTADFCPGVTLPSGVGDFQGPVQTVNIITDKDSSQKSISAEALYYVFGLGPSQANVAPWTVDADTVARSATSFVHLFVAAAVGLPATGFKAGVTVSTNDLTVSNVTTLGAANPEATLGYVSGSAADAARSSVKTLAYQHTGQICGYWPDSTETALDKLNVREGQYFLWTPGHFFAKIDQQNQIIDPAVAKLVGWFTDSLTPPDGLDVTKLIIQSGDVPQCAMHVRREGVIGAISSWAPAAPCGCFFEATATNQVPTGCTACATDGDCGGSTPKCHHNFCEAY